MLEKTSTHEEALAAQMEFYNWFVRQQGRGPHQPATRQLKQFIQLVFKRAGIEALRKADLAILSERKVSAASPQAGTGEKKSAGELRRANKDRQPRKQEQELQTQASLNRLNRVAQRKREAGKGKLEEPDQENVVETKPAQGAANLTKNKEVPKTGETGEMGEVKLITTEEAKEVLEMNGKQIAEKVGRERLVATLAEMGVEAEKLSGSDAQLGNRLKSLLKSKK